MTSENSLKVHESYTRDSGRGVARIDEKTMKQLLLNVGDIIEIYGTKKAVAKCLPLYPADENKNIIRFDGLIRNNCNAKIGNCVSVRKIQYAKAKHVTVTPLESIPPVDERYMADALESVPLIPRQNIMIPYFGGRLSFTVIDVFPKIDDSIEAVIVNQNTMIQIYENKKFPQDADIGEKRQFILHQLIKLEDLNKDEFEELILKITELYKEFRDKKDMQKS